MLHERLATLFDHFGKLGAALGRATDSYNAAVGSFERMVKPAVRKLEELGAADKKAVDEIDPVGVRHWQRLMPVTSQCEETPPGLVVLDLAHVTASNVVQCAARLLPAPGRNSMQYQPPSGNLPQPDMPPPLPLVHFVHCCGRPWVLTVAVAAGKSGLVERLGKYNRYAGPGIHGVIPIFERMYKVNIPEIMVKAEPQEIIMSDKLNANVDAQVYLKVKGDEESVKASLYNVTNYENQVVNLARTTLRNIIGTLSLKSANSERGKINEELRTTLRDETASWGIEILRTELKEIDPPDDVQETMNKVVKADNEKVAAIDFATAIETQADGARRAEIKKAEGTSRPRSSKPRARPRPSSSSTRPPTSTSSATPRCCASSRPSSGRSTRTARSSCPADTQLVNVIGDLGGLLPMPTDDNKSTVKIEAVS